MYKTSPIYLLIGLMILVLSSELLAQPIDEEEQRQVILLQHEIATAERQLHRIDEMLPKVRKYESIARFIAFFIFCTGLIITALESRNSDTEPKKRFSGLGSLKYWVMTLGVILSVAEATRVFYFPHNHELLTTKVKKVTNLVDSANNDLEKLKVLLESEYGLLANLVTDFRQNVEQKLDEAEEHLEELNIVYYDYDSDVSSRLTMQQTDAFRLSLFKVAHAQQETENTRSITVQVSGNSIDEAKVKAYEEIKLQVHAKVKQVASGIFSDPRSFQNCINTTQSQLTPENITNTLVNYYFDDRAGSLSRDEETGQFSVSVDIVFPHSLEQTTEHLIYDEISRASIPDDCNTGVAGVYYGDWESEDYPAGGELVMALDESEGGVTTVRIIKMTGSRFVLPDLKGGLNAVGATHEANLVGDSTKVTGSIQNGKIEGEYDFRFGWFNLMRDEGRLTLNKVADRYTEPE